MSYRNKTDLHMHTSSSFDGNFSAVEMCTSAIEKGLTTIAITDHFDVDFYEAHNLGVRGKTSYADILAAREELGEKIRILRGIEIGQGTYDQPLTEETLTSREYDFVIGSIHNLRNMPDFGDLKYSEMTDDEIYTLLEQYFAEMLLLAKWNGFDTLAHLTYPMRYIVQSGRNTIDLSRFDAVTDEIFKTLIANGKALEINTSGLRQPIGKTMPTENYVRRFKELGGEFLTIGSDAHFTEHVGANIDDGFEIAERCGFDCVTYFENRKPVQVKIEK